MKALALGSGRLFVGGGFTGPFTNLGALNPATGAVVWSWSPPAVPSEVRALVVVGTRLFAGGDFGVRVYDTASGAQQATFTCNSVRALEPDATNGWVVVGGNFGTCGGQTHRNLARISVAGLTVDASWNPSDERQGPDHGRRQQRHLRRRRVLVDVPIQHREPATGSARWPTTAASTRGTPPTCPTRATSAQTTGKSVRAMDLANGRVFASWGESVNKTVIYNQATAAFIARWVSDGDTQAVLASGGNVYVGGHWFRYMGPNVNSAAVYFAAFDAASLAKETVVAPISGGYPHGRVRHHPRRQRRAVVGRRRRRDLGSVGRQGQAPRAPDVRVEPAPADHDDELDDDHHDHHHARDDHHRRRRRAATWHRTPR